MHESSDVMKDIAELIKEYGYITPEIAAKNVRLCSAYEKDFKCYQKGSRMAALVFIL